GLVFVQADVGDLRVRVSTQWDGHAAAPAATLNQGVWVEDAGQGVGAVRELEAREDVAGGVIVRIVVLLRSVDEASFSPAMAHAGRVEVETFHVRHPAGADEERIDDNFPLSPGARKMNDFFVVPLLHASYFAAQD